MIESALGMTDSLSGFSRKSRFHLWVPALPELEAALADLQFLDLGVKSRRWNSELGCSPVGTVNAASGLSECSFNDLLLASRVIVRGLRHALLRPCLRGVSG